MARLAIVEPLAHLVLAGIPELVEHLDSPASPVIQVGAVLADILGTVVLAERLVIVELQALVGIQEHLAYPVIVECPDTLGIVVSLVIVDSLVTLGSLDTAASVVPAGTLALVGQVDSQGTVV